MVISLRGPGALFGVFFCHTVIISLALPSFLSLLKDQLVAVDLPFFEGAPG